MKRYTLYADGQYDVGFGEVYGEFLGHQRKSSQTNIQQLFPIIAPEAPCGVNPFNCVGASYGNAFLAALAVGDVQRTDIGDWNPVTGEVAADPENAAVYTDRYAVFRELYPRTRDLMRRLDA